jgi:hypothetical protein
MARMHKHAIPILAAVTVALAIAVAAAPSSAHAAWCWPSCSTYGYLGPGTSTYNGCWYSSGEVCSGWNTWSSNGIAKGCYPKCDWPGYTQARVLYGFENTQRIRGFYEDFAVTRYVYPYQLGMGGYLRAQASWAPYSDSRISYTSWIHVGAV